MPEIKELNITDDVIPALDQSLSAETYRFESGLLYVEAQDTQLYPVREFTFDVDHGVIFDITYAYSGPYLRVAVISPGYQSEAIVTIDDGACSVTSGWVGSSGDFGTRSDTKSGEYRYFRVSRKRYMVDGFTGTHDYIFVDVSHDKQTWEPVSMTGEMADPASLDNSGWTVSFEFAGNMYLGPILGVDLNARPYDFKLRTTTGWVSVATPEKPLKLRLADNTWATLNSRENVPGPKLYVRQGSDWLFVASAAPPANNYVQLDFNDTYGNLYAAQLPQYLPDTYWASPTADLWQRADYIEYLGVENAMIKWLPPGYHLGKNDNEISRDGLIVLSYSESSPYEVIPERAGYRQKTDTLGWFDVPIGAAIAEIELMKESKGFAGDAPIKKVDVVHNVGGSSNNLYATAVYTENPPIGSPWNVDRNNTVVTPTNARGRIWYQGISPRDTTVEAYYLGRTYDLAQPSGKSFRRETTGTKIVDMLLNDTPAQDPNNPYRLVGNETVQHVPDWANLTVRDSMRYHVEIDEVPNPPAFDFQSLKQDQNVMQVRWLVRVYY